MAAEVTSDASSPELGKFLRATQAIRRGELVLQEVPLFRVSDQAGLPEDVASAAARLKAEDLFVPSEDSPPLQQIYRRKRNESKDALYIRTLLHFNSFAAGMTGDEQAIFKTFSRANHSCDPNVIVDADEGTMRALKDIACGEQLHVSYLGDEALLWPADRRQAELRERWDFTCCCSRCSVPLDDMRSFSACECGDDFLVRKGQLTPALCCTNCGASPSMSQLRTFLTAEVAAQQALDHARSGMLDEEEEGQELIRCSRFASKHPSHSLALELAFEFAFPDPVVAQRALLQGWAKRFGNTPSQLCIRANKELARLLEERRQPKEAAKYLQEAAEIACCLDGRTDVKSIIKELRGELVNARRVQQRLQPSQKAGNSLDLDWGGRADVSPKPVAAESNVANGPSMTDGGKGASHQGCEGSSTDASKASLSGARDGGCIKEPVQILSWPSTMHIALPLSITIGAALFAGVFHVWLSRQHRR